ncbi:MAG: MFS transporter [Holosporaceae bacterium]|jgi:MHS family proline/betaine transporter-like MFS transporter|nr:MFS transporter [Holosporaceae bacterium]
MFKINLEKHESLIEILGNVLVWYNFALFMPFLHILSAEFFPLKNTVQREMLSFLALSAGLFMRPFGAAVFGPLGDRLGRRKSISISILLMVIPTVCIGLLPNFRQVGICAPILLLIFRALQGISLGGEYTTAMVHLVERAPPHRRSFWGSFTDAGSQIGVLLGGQALVLLHSFFSPEEIYSFAWRIPFLGAVVLAPFSFLVPASVSNKKDKPKVPIFRTLLKYKKEVLCTASITAFSAVGFYTLLTFLPYYLVGTNIMTLQEATTCSVYSTLIMVIFILMGGYLSDTYSKAFFMIFGIVGVSITMYFMFLLPMTTFKHWLILQLSYGSFLGLYYSSRAAFFAEAYPEHIRCTAVSLSLSFAQALFGGMTPLAINYASKISPLLPAMAVTVIAICAFSALIALKKKKLANERDLHF